MNAVDIDPDSQTLKLRSSNASKEIAWSSIVQATISRMPSLFDEIGLVLKTPQNEVFVRETQPAYQALFSHLMANAELPDNWYSQVESGAVISIPLNFEC